MRKILFAWAILIILFLWVESAAAQGGEQPIGVYETDPGSVCEITTANNDSVHPRNLLVITNGEQILEVPGAEDEAFSEVSVRFTAEVDTISVTVQLAPTEFISSLELTVSCESPPPSTTTTTTPPPPEDDCVAAGTCHPDTGGTDWSYLVLGLSGAMGLVGAWLLITAHFNTTRDSFS